jgi:hypothetical protein
VGEWSYHCTASSILKPVRRELGNGFSFCIVCSIITHFNLCFNLEKSRISGDLGSTGIDAETEVMVSIWVRSASHRYLKFRKKEVTLLSVNQEDR